MVCLKVAVFALMAVSIGMFVACAGAASDDPAPTTAPPGPPGLPGATKKEAKDPAPSQFVIEIKTSVGMIKAELWPDKAPATVTNVLKYVKDGFYDGLIFHRVIAGFMIQGGGFTPDMKQKANGAPVRNEARADVPNKRGTLAMARTADVNSATSQFFINLVDNKFLDHKDESARGFGYCVFGEVIDGMDVVNRIGKTKTGSSGRFSDVPVKPVVIESIRVAK